MIQTWFHAFPFYFQIRTVSCISLNFNLRLTGLSDPNLPMVPI